MARSSRRSPRQVRVAAWTPRRPASAQGTRAPGRSRDGGKRRPEEQALPWRRRAPRGPARAARAPPPRRRAHPPDQHHPLPQPVVAVMVMVKHRSSTSSVQRSCCAHSRQSCQQPARHPAALGRALSPSLCRPPPPLSAPWRRARCRHDRPRNEPSPRRALAVQQTRARGAPEGARKQRGPLCDQRGCPSSPLSSHATTTPPIARRGVHGTST
mmetsp:Transcript_28672/g.67187  ORF Transcript_28672/g.67187 Transcript_28672/m.67187 type:complete len:213 (-) Transcript_28672:727-1365(-)